MMTGVERSLIWTVAVALVMIGMYVGSLSNEIKTHRGEIDRMRSTPERLARIETELIHLRASIDQLATAVRARDQK
jgi:hypothetical protein